MFVRKFAKSVPVASDEVAIMHVCFLLLYIMVFQLIGKHRSRSEGWTGRLSQEKRAADKDDEKHLLRISLLGDERFHKKMRKAEGVYLYSFPVVLAAGYVINLLVVSIPHISLAGLIAVLAALFCCRMKYDLRYAQRMRSHNQKGRVVAFTGKFLTSLILLIEFLLVCIVLYECYSPHPFLMGHVLSGPLLAQSQILLCAIAALVYYCLLKIVVVLDQLIWVVESAFTRAEFSDAFNRDTTLYLHSFANDKVKIWAPVTRSYIRSAMAPVTTFEEYLSLLPSFSFYAGDGLVALGSEFDPIPRIGAARMYYPDDDYYWKKGVRTSAARAKRILLVAGNTDSLLWEAQMLCDNHLLPKTLIAVPPVDSGRVREYLESILPRLGVEDGAIRFELQHCELERLVGFTINMSGAIEWIYAPERDWASYFMLLESYRPEGERYFIKNDWHRPAKCVRRPLHPDANVRNTLAMTRGALKAMKHQDYSEAWRRLNVCLHLSGALGLGDGAYCSIAFLWLKCLDALENKQLILAKGISIYNLIKTSGVDWIWVSPLEVIRRDEALRDVALMITRAFSKNDEETSREYALRAIEHAYCCPDLNGVIDAYYALGVSTSDRGEQAMAFQRAANYAEQQADLWNWAKVTRQHAIMLESSNGDADLCQELYFEACGIYDNVGEKQLAVECLLGSRRVAQSGADGSVNSRKG